MRKSTGIGGIGELHQGIAEIGGIEKSALLDEIGELHQGIAEIGKFQIKCSLW